MPSPLDILNAQAAGINTCSPAARVAASPVQNVMIHQNPLTCYTDCAVPPTPASALLQPNLGSTCDTLQVCVSNTGTAPIVLVLGGDCFFGDTTDETLVFRALQDITAGLVPANAAASAVDCTRGVAVGQGPFAPTVRALNCITSDIPIAITGKVTKVTPISETGDVALQLSNPITAFEIDPWNGGIFDICTRTEDAAICGPCVNGSGSDNVTTYNEACLDYIDSLHGIALQIQPGVRVLFQACYAGIADINNYRSCSTPSYNVNPNGGY